MLEIPEWLAPDFTASFLSTHNDLDCSGLLKPETKTVWLKLESDMEAALFRIQNIDVATVAGAVVGAFVSPLAFGYGETGTADRPSWKTRIRQRQREADILKEQAINLAWELADVLSDLKTKTLYLPDAAHEFDINALRELAEALDKHQKTKELFSEIPGMESNKSSWQDWQREAEANLKLCNRMYRGGFELTESEWDVLTKALFGKTRKARNYVTKSETRKVGNIFPENPKK